MYGKRRCGIQRDGQVFVAGEGSHQNIGRAEKTAGGYHVLWVNRRYEGYAKTKREAKIMLFNKAKKQDECIIRPNEYINNRGKLMTRKVDSKSIKIDLDATSEHVADELLDEVFPSPHELD